MLKVLSLRVKNVLQAPPRVKMCPKEANNVTKGWGLRYFGALGSERLSE